MPLIADVLEYYAAVNGRHVLVPESGGERPMKCPFHEDSHASASVNLTTGLFNCHGCEVNGDPYKLVIDQEGISFAEAKQRVADISGTDVRDLPGRDNPRDHRLLARTGANGRGNKLVSSRNRGSRR